MWIFVGRILRGRECEGRSMNSVFKQKEENAAGTGVIGTEVRGGTGAPIIYITL